MNVRIIKKMGCKDRQGLSFTYSLGIISDLLVNFDATGKGSMENMYLVLTMWHLGNKQNIKEGLYWEFGNIIKEMIINFVGSGDKPGPTWLLTSF